MCRILIGLSVRLMLLFDVFQGSMPGPNSREKDGKNEGGARNQNTETQTLGVDGLWETESLHHLPGDGLIVLPICI